MTDSRADVGGGPHDLGLPVVGIDLERIGAAAVRGLETDAAVLSVLPAGARVTSGTASVAHLAALDAVCEQALEAGAAVAEPGLALAVPLIAAGRTIGALGVVGDRSRTWTERDRVQLEDLAQWAVTELELGRALAAAEGGRVAWRLAVDAAEVGAFEWNLVTGELRWDERLLELFGVAGHSFGGTIEAFDALVHPEDRPRVSDALSRAIETVGEYVAEYRVVRPDGGVRWIAARGRALADRPGGAAVQLVGAAYDTTAVQEGEARVARILESMSSAFFQLDDSWRFTYANAEAERLLGLPRAQMVGGVVWDLFPAAVDSEFERQYRHAVASGEPVTFDAYYPPLEAWYEVRAWPSPDGLAVYFTDVSARHAAQAELDAAARRGQILAGVTEALAGTLDAAEGVSRLATLLVPRIADWCLVTLVDNPHSADWRQGLRDVGWAHVDPAQLPTLERYATLRLQAMTDASYLAEALRNRQSNFCDAGAADQIAAVLVPGEAQDLVRVLDPSSMFVVPLRGRDRTVGVLSTFRGPDRAAFDDDERLLLEDIAARAGLALDNARLYAEQRDVAAALQRNLLTEPPRLEHLEVGVRYAPAGEAAQVGGDWYDAFLQPGGQAMVVVGDVVGHDLEAAAAMGQVRGLLRGIAAHSGGTPAEVVTGVDEVLEVLQVETTATAVVALLEPADDHGMIVRWANAGHPPPMLVTADGEVRVLVGPQGNDLLLGLDPGTPRSEHRAVLEPGSTLLLYTDGLVERRSQHIDAGVERLTEHLSTVVRLGTDVEGLCDELLVRMVPDQAEDDVALVAVRLKEHAS